MYFTCSWIHLTSIGNSQWLSVLFRCSLASLTLLLRTFILLFSNYWHIRTMVNLNFWESSVSFLLGFLLEIMDTLNFLILKFQYFLIFLNKLIFQSFIFFSLSLQFYLQLFHNLSVFINKVSQLFKFLLHFVNGFISFDDWIFVTFNGLLTFLMIMCVWIGFRTLIRYL